MLKPQLGGFLAVYYVIHYRAWLPALIGGGFTLAHWVMPNPAGNMLMFEWIDNILHPTTVNSAIWTSTPVGPRWLLFLLLPIIYYIHRERWTQERTIATLLIVPMTLSPYVSYQSVVVPVTMLSGGVLTLVQWVLASFTVAAIVWYFLLALLLGGFDVVLLQKLKSNRQETIDGRTPAG